MLNVIDFTLDFKWFSKVFVSYRWRASARLFSFQIAMSKSATADWTRLPRGFKPSLSCHYLFWKRSGRRRKKSYEKNTKIRRDECKTHYELVEGEERGGQVDRNESIGAGLATEKKFFYCKMIRWHFHHTQLKTHGARRRRLGTPNWTPTLLYYTHTHTHSFKSKHIFQRPGKESLNRKCIEQASSYVRQARSQVNLSKKV